MTRNQPSKRTLVYEGVVGLCPCCLGTTEIRLGSTGGVPEEETWVVPEALMYAIYNEIASRVRLRYDGDKPFYYILDPSDSMAIVRNKVFFVGGDGTELAGPFGFVGLKVFLQTRLNSDRERVYIVNTTSRALAVIRNSPYAMITVDLQSTPEATDLF